MRSEHRHGLCQFCKDYQDCEMKGVSRMEYANIREAKPEDPVEVRVFACDDFEGATLSSIIDSKTALDQLIAAHRPLLPYDDYGRPRPRAFQWPPPPPVTVIEEDPDTDRLDQAPPP